MTQPKINAFVTDCEQPATLNRGDDYANKNDSTPANDNACGRSSASGQTPRDKVPSGSKVKSGKNSCKKSAKKGKKSKQRKDIKSKSKGPTPNKDVPITQILGESLSEMLASNTPVPENDSDNSSRRDCVMTSPQASSSPSRVDRTALDDSSVPVTQVTRRGTRLNAVKEQLVLKMEENTRLKNVVDLLEKEIDRKTKELECKNKTDSAQKSEIKKLTTANNDLRRELSKFKDMRKYTTEPSSGAKDQDNNDISVHTGDIDTNVGGLMKQVITATKTLLAAVEHNDGDTFTEVIHRRRRQRTADIPDESPSEVSPSTRNHSTGRAAPDVATRNGPSQAASNSSQPSYAAAAARPSVPRKVPQVAIIGTSLVRGLGPRLTRRGIDASTFVYRGQEIPAIGQQIPGILNKDFQPDIIILQCGGNDAENGRPPAQIVQQLDLLIREVKHCCPGARVVINKIPPRGRNEQLMNIISMINTFTSNLARDKRRRVHCSDTCPTSFRFYQADEIHFNNEGKKLYANAMYKVISNFTKLLLKQKR